jgi:hypothetical protein
MFHVNRHKFGSIVLFSLVAVFIVALLASTVAPALAQPLTSKKTSRQAYHDEWRKLWEDHITWTRVVIISILGAENELPGTEAYIARLLQNYEDMEDALAPYYGEDAEVLGDLIKDHLVIAAAILRAAKAGQPLDDLIASWYANAHDIAVQMNEMNPQFWPLEETEQMWVEHLDATLAEAVAHLEGRFEDEVAAYDLVHDLALEMADFMSNGVIKQFPSKFKGSDD